MDPINAYISFLNTPVIHAITSELKMRDSGLYYCTLDQCNEAQLQLPDSSSAVATSQAN